MTDIFLKVVGMSATACLVIAAVIVLRLVLKKAPKNISYMLWAAVFFRLLCPVSIDIPIGVVTPVSVEAHNMDNYRYDGDKEDNVPVSATLNPENNSFKIYTSESRFVPAYKNNRLFLEMSAAVWISGAAVMAAYGIISFIALKKRLKGAVFSDGAYISRNIDDPFILGIIKPRIYLPEGLGLKERGFILKHENAHIARKDHIVKIVMYAALCVHWFNPLVWLSFKLCERDMEMSCDQKVTGKLSPEDKADYSQILLDITPKKTAAFTACFGESGTKQRVKNVLYYKKPALWAVVLCVIAAAVSTLFLVTNKAGAFGNTDRYRIINFGDAYWIESTPCDYVVPSENGYISLMDGDLSEYNGILNGDCFKGDIKRVEDGKCPVYDNESDFPFEGKLYTTKTSGHYDLNEVSVVMSECTEEFYNRLKALNSKAYHDYNIGDISLLFKNEIVSESDMLKFYEGVPEVIPYGEAMDKSELAEFSPEAMLNGNTPYWHNDIYSPENAKTDGDDSWKFGEFLNGLNHSKEAKDLFNSAKTLLLSLNTENILYNDNFTGGGSHISVRNHKYEHLSYIRYDSTGIDYDSFYNMFRETFTEDTLKLLFEKYPFFYNYNGELYCSYDSVCEQLHDILYREYELVKENDKEMTFNGIYYQKPWSDETENAVYDPAKKDAYEITVIEYKFVNTKDGWRVEKMSDITNNNTYIELYSY